MEQRRCIYHYPNPIDNNPKSGSALRPMKMLNAFKEAGYIVDEVTGYGKQRKENIKTIKENIKKGIKYDFLYSESVTLPTAMSEPDHLPKYPFMDFSFMKYCKKSGIKIGLFYRDIYWKFPIYKQTTKGWIPYVTIPFYKYDLRKYKKYVDILYVPSKEFTQYVGEGYIFKPLPPGCEDRMDFENEIATANDFSLELFYVGGISGLYDIRKLVSAVKRISSIRLTICCRKEEWLNSKNMYENLLSDNIEIIHESGDALKKYYDRANIACAFFENNAYRDMAMPIKLFEYVGYGKPIIATEGTAAASFIADNNIGWSIPYSSEKMEELLRIISSSKDEVIKKKKNINDSVKKNTWLQRALTVAKDLS